MPASTGSPTVPTLQGWHLVSFQNGDTAVVRWNGSNWVWGSIKAPASPITGIEYLGATTADFSQPDPQNPGYTYFVTAIQGLPANVQGWLMRLADFGVLSKGQPVLLSSSGKLIGGSTASGNEATPTNIIPSPISPGAGNSHLSVPSLGSILGFLGSTSFWAGLGMSLAGAALVAFGVFQLAGVGKTTAIRVLR